MFDKWLCKHIQKKEITLEDTVEYLSHKLDKYLTFILSGLTAIVNILIDIAILLVGVLFILIMLLTPLVAVYYYTNQSYFNCIISTLCSIVFYFTVAAALYDHFKTKVIAKCPNNKE